jgi:hypothetical protein
MKDLSPKGGTPSDDRHSVSATRDLQVVRKPTWSIHQLAGTTLAGTHIGLPFKGLYRDPSKYDDSLTARFGAD